MVLNNKEKLEELLSRVDTILTEVDKLANKYGHSKKKHIRQTLSDVRDFKDLISKEIYNAKTKRE